VVTDIPNRCGDHVSNLLAQYAPDAPPADDVAQLDEPLTPSELLTAAAGGKALRSPGPDGLMYEVYQNPLIGEFLAPLLAEAENTPQDGGLLTVPLNGCHMSDFYTKKGDRTQLSNWRPIALTNSDGKIVNGALDTRLQSVLPALVHPDQVGFVPGRSVDTPIPRAQNLFRFNFLPTYNRAYGSAFPLLGR
jgi:Reverse transcriptase (RNA-dependent DNA polymerase)